MVSKWTWILGILLLFITPVTGVVITDLAVIPRGAHLTRLELIKHYFFHSLSYKDISLLLYIVHNIKLSLRQLKRILKANNFARRKTRTPAEEVRDHIIVEIQRSAKCVGYRSMWQKLVTDYRLVVSRNSVMRLMREIDPEGTKERKAHRLSRRKYVSKGPNFVWHVDGYDKLKPYGFCIHGAIDGYSRRILWLEVSNSNNSPAVIASYYLDTLSELRIAPRLLRCDRGTENSKLALLQPFFRHNGTESVSGLKSFMYGRSVANQRIESWWGILRRQGVHFSRIWLI